MRGLLFVMGGIFFFFKFLTFKFWHADSLDTNSLVVARKLLAVAGGVSLFPSQALNLGPLHWECGVLATVPPGKSSPPNLFFSFNIELLILGLLSLYINSRISLLISPKKLAGILIGVGLNL